MRAIRALVAVLTFALIGLVPATATAAPTAGEATSARLAAKAEPKVGAKIVKKKGKLFMIGNVKPAKGKVTIQKATKCNQKTKKCNFKRFKRVSIGNNGRYKVRVYAPKRGNWYWRAVKGSATSTVWRTYTI